MMKWIGSIDRISEGVAYIILNDDEHELRIPASCLPKGADEGMAYTIEITRNKDEEARLQAEIEALRKDLL